MGTLTSGSIDLNSLKVAGEPNKYITKINDNGITVHAANNSSLNYVAINANGMEIFKSNGASTPSASSVAYFGETVRIGASNTGNVTIQPSGIDFYGGDGTTNLAHIGYGNVKTQTGVGTSPYYTFGGLITPSEYSSSYSYIVGDVCTYDGKTYVCTVDSSMPETWDSSHWSDITIGSYSFALGRYAVARGQFSFAHGTGLNVLGKTRYTDAYGFASHAEGVGTVAIGNGSHAEGCSTIAKGVWCHAEGNTTIAGSSYQHVQGKYNIEDLNDAYADIVGGGSTDLVRKNIEATTWTGDKRMKGDVYVGCNDDSTGGTRLFPASLTRSGAVAISVSHNTWTYLEDTSNPNNCKVELTEPGIYILFGAVRFASNATGRRAIRWYNATSSEIVTRSNSNETAVSGVETYVQTTLFTEVTTPMTYKLQAYHNAGTGTSLNVTPFISVVRLA